jgi:hypothetical protein
MVLGRSSGRPAEVAGHGSRQGEEEAFYLFFV